MNRPSNHRALKVKTFFNSPGNADFEDVLIFNPSLNICRGKAETVNAMTCIFTSNPKIFKGRVSWERHQCGDRDHSW